MKTLVGIVAALAAAGLAWAVTTQAVNSTCPVKAGTPVKAGITSNYKGKTVGFCCNNCKGNFDANPEKFASSIPELAGPVPPASLSSIDDGLKAGKDNKPVVILFVGTDQRSDIFEKKVLADPSLSDSIGKVAYVKVNFKKDDEDSKKWKVTAAPTLLIVDAVQDPPKEIKRVTGGTPASLKKEFETAIRKLEKK